MADDNKELIEAIGDMMSVVLAAEQFVDTDSDFFTNSKLEAELRRAVSKFQQTNTYKRMRGWSIANVALEARVTELEKRVSKLEAGDDTKQKSALFCEHANEVPQACPCPLDCYCKGRTCSRL